MAERQGGRGALVSTCQVWELRHREALVFLKPPWPNGLTRLCLKSV